MPNRVRPDDVLLGYPTMWPFMFSLTNAVALIGWVLLAVFPRGGP